MLNDFKSILCRWLIPRLQRGQKFLKFVLESLLIRIEERSRTRCEFGNRRHGHGLLKIVGSRLAVGRLVWRNYAGNRQDRWLVYQCLLQRLVSINLHRTGLAEVLTLITPLTKNSRYRWWRWISEFWKKQMVSRIDDWTSLINQPNSIQALVFMEKYQNRNVKKTILWNRDEIHWDRLWDRLESC